MKKAKHGGNIYEIAQRLSIKKEEIIDFSANINPLGVPKSFKKALVENMDVIENYPDPEYNTLIEDIATYHGLEKEYITVGNGATEVIFSMISNLKPKKSLILAPTFLEYERALLRSGSYVNYYYLKEENNFQVDEQFLEAIDEKLDLVVICNPNNPTSQLIGREEMTKILECCKKKNINLMIDEAFTDFVDDPNSVSMMPFIKDYDNLYIIKALTKFYALAGLRIGYGITVNVNLLEKIKDHKEPWTINSYAAMAGMVLKDKDYIKESRAWILSERAYFYDALKKIDKIKVYKPASNYILFQLLNEKKDIREALLQKKILIRSCNNYKNLDPSFYRIAIKNREQNEKFINAFKEVLYEG
ncbi:threonine-phosphate decarboxylase CobD [Marinisporobacter balticus]|uniref:threonine-phosphate decarboxylase n=1 Tax=Marinisporobacter balticus TaxID=2018667 RepID=A0A4V2SCJ4_9FIRM|nr:threonine-phosphate decarboxylase CobD [Marinisporobacter balticus]TCO79500.1 L-threonine O-3-phosphate decarboxylase [Marinisporobacter balticus]